MVRDLVAVGALDAERGKGRARGKDDGAVSPLDSLLKCALSLGEGVAEGEQDGAAVRATTVDRVLESTDAGLGEDAIGGGETNEGTGADILDDLLEGAELLAVVVGTGKVLLVLSKVVTTVLGDETLGVYEPETVTGLGLAETTLGVVLNQLLGNTDTGGTGTHKDEALVLDGDARQVDGANVTAENDGTGALDVVVEAAVGVAVAVEVVEGLFTLKVLKLDNHVGVDLLDGIHELVHKVLLDALGSTLLADAEVEGVLEVGLVVRASVENNGQSLFGVNTGGGSVQRKLANLQRLALVNGRASQFTYRDTDAIYAEITETENTGAIGDDANLGVGAGPVTEHGLDGAALLDGNVQGLGAGIQGRVLEADVADGGGIYEGHEVADVVHEEAVEEVDVLGLEIRQVEVLVNVGLAGLDHLHGADALGLEALHGVREQTGEVLGDTLFGGEGEAWLVSRGAEETGAPVQTTQLRGAGRSDKRRRRRRQDSHTLVPVGLTDNLVAGGILLGEVLGGVVLLDLAEAVLGIATMLVQGRHFHGFLDGGNIDCTHWIALGQFLCTGGQRRMLVVSGERRLRRRADGAGRDSGGNRGRGGGARGGNVGGICADGVGRSHWQGRGR